MAHVFCDARLPAEALERLRTGVGLRRLRMSARPSESNLSPAGPDPEIANAEIIFGQPSLESLEAATRLRWVHLTSAGYARYAAGETRALLLRRGIRLTTSSAVYAVPCAEQALAGMLMLTRRLDLCLEEQRAAEWRSDEHRRQSGLLFGSRVVLLGFGAIGRALAPRLEALGAQVIAARRQPSAEDPVLTVRPDALEPHLARADFVVSLLPGGEATRGFVDAPFLSRVKRGAFFVNVGRGTTVVQDALLDALRAGQLGGAYLDVTEPEPLPEGHPLWTAPRAVLSPHVAGGQPGEPLALVEHFLENLGRFDRGEPLLDRAL